MTVVSTFAESHYIVSSAIPGSVATDAETDKCWKYNDLLDNYYFQPAAIKTTGVYDKSTSPFSAVLQRNSLTCQATPGCDSGSTSACPWSKGTLPAYWPVCKFDLISTIFCTLNSVPAHHLPFFDE